MTCLDQLTRMRLAAALIEADGSVSGLTLVTPDGEVTYLDAEVLRRGGRA
jgi:hypothetical protein